MKPTKPTKPTNWAAIIGWALVLGQIVITFFTLKDRFAKKDGPEGSVTILPPAGSDTSKKIYEQLPADAKEKVKAILKQIHQATGIELSLDQVVAQLIEKGLIKFGMQDATI